MHQSTVTQLFLIILFFMFSNSLFPQSSTPPDTTSKQAPPDSKKIDISKSIQQLIKKHYRQKKVSTEKPFINKVDKKSRTSMDSLRTIPSIIINDDNVYTKSQEVKLKITAPNATHIKVSNFETFPQTAWIPVTSSMTWKLIKGSGHKKVYLKLLYPDSSESSVYSDEIILDMTPPVVKFIVAPDTGVAGEVIFEYFQNFRNPLLINFDVSGSYGYEGQKSLEIRWDFDADSLWDTEWSVNKKITHTYSNFDKQIVRMEVRDSTGLTNIVSQTIRNNYYNMVFIPAGNFMMGSNNFEIDERPVHSVFVEDFWIDKYPVTNQQYADFLNTQKIDTIDDFIDLNSAEIKIHQIDLIYIVDEGFEHHPVVEVSWNGAQAYAQFYGKSLPTEAEWEKAARGDDERLYPWGNEISGNRANFWDSGDPFDNNTTPVGFFDGRNYNGFQTVDSPSPFGVYDLVDNVREWCSDWYQRNYYSLSPLKNPTGPDSGTRRVVRGGGYLFYPKTLRSSYRSSYDPVTTTSYIGFRCVIRKQY